MNEPNDTINTINTINAQLQAARARQEHAKYLNPLTYTMNREWILASQDISNLLVDLRQALAWLG